MKKLLLLLMLISLPVSAQDIKNDIETAMLMSCNSKNQFVIQDPKRLTLCMQAFNAKMQIQILEELKKLNKINSINPSTD